MGYSITIAIPPIANNDGAAWEFLEAASDDEGLAPAVFKDCHELLVQRYPCLSSLTDDAADNGVWKDGPLWNNFGALIAHLSIVSSRANEVLPFVIDTARSLGLYTFDWETRYVHRPDGLVHTTLTLESRPPLKAPTLRQIENALELLSPGQGTGFMVVDGRDNDYVQVAGGDGVFTCEWRQHSGQTLQHYVAGYANIPPNSNVRIATNSAFVTVRNNEMLKAADAIELLTAFATDRERPTQFVWRDIAERLG